MTIRCRLVLALACLPAVLGVPAHAQVYEINWYTIDGDLEQFSDFHLVLVYTDEGWAQPPAE